MKNDVRTFVENKEKKNNSLICKLWSKCSLRAQHLWKKKSNVAFSSSSSSLWQFYSNFGLKQKNRKKPKQFLRKHVKWFNKKLAPSFCNSSVFRNSEIKRGKMECSFMFWPIFSIHNNYLKKFRKSTNSNFH